MSFIKIKREKIIRRRKRVRSKIKGTANRPRLTLFRSNKHLWAQVIDDESGKTLLAASDKEAVADKGSGLKKNAAPLVWAEETGKLLAKKAQERKINSVVFDRGSYRYHGLLKAFAQGARQGGLKF